MIGKSLLNVERPLVSHFIFYTQSMDSQHFHTYKSALWSSCLRPAFEP